MRATCTGRVIVKQKTGRADIWAIQVSGGDFWPDRNSIELYYYIVYWFNLTACITNVWVISLLAMTHVI
jgi:hypothetical protein